MSEREKMSENIRRVMESLHAAHKASHEAEEDLNEETVNALQQKLRKLYEELETVNWLETHPGSAVMDHFHAAISKWVFGRKANYRRSPQLPTDSKHESGTDKFD